MNRNLGLCLMAAGVMAAVFCAGCPSAPKGGADDPALEPEDQAGDPAAFPGAAGAGVWISPPGRPYDGDPPAPFPGGADAGNPWCAPHVEEQFYSLKHHGEWLGFHKGGEGQQCDKDPAIEVYDNHNQGIVRRPGPGTPYFIVTRSVEPPGSSTVLVVQMGSRGATGERLRSNRLRSGSHTNYVAPPTADRVLHHFAVPPPQTPGDYSRVYKHPGSMQIVDDIVPIPLEKPRDAGDPKAKIIFMDISYLPDRPLFLPYSLDLDGNEGRPEHNAGILGMTKLPEPDGRYLMAFTWGHNEALEFWVSTVTDLRHLGPTEQGGAGGVFERYYTLYPSSDYWPIKVAWDDPDVTKARTGCYQGINFVWDARTGGLYLVGFRNTDSRSPMTGFGGSEEACLYKVFLSFDPDTKMLMDGGHVSTTPVFPKAKHMWTQVLGMGIDDSKQANFAAGTGIYVSPAGELIAYACEHWTDGPSDTYKMAEFRHRDVFRPYSPAYGPQVRVGGYKGTYVVDEGSVIPLDGSATGPPLAEAWVEMYEDTNWEADSVTFDVVDRALIDWPNFSHIEDRDFTNGFNDDASSLRWFAPPGGKFTVCSNYDGKGESKLPLNGVGIPRSVSNLHTNKMGDKFSSLVFDGTRQGAVTGISWSFRASPPLGVLTDSTTYTPLYEAIEGTYVDGEPSVELVDCTATSNLVWPNGANAYNSATARIIVRNLAAEVSIDGFDGKAGAVIDPSVPVLLEGIEFEVLGSFTDAGVEDTHVATVGWGDSRMTHSDDATCQLTDSLGGAVGTVSATYAYGAKGTYPITLEVQDDDGDVGLATRTVEVEGAGDATNRAIEELEALLALGLNANAAQEIAAARFMLKGNEGGVPVNGVLGYLEDGQREAALLKVRQAMEFIASAAVCDPALVGQLQSVARKIAFVAKSVATKTIWQAQTVALSWYDQTRIACAYDCVALGDAYLEAGAFWHAVCAYESALKAAESIL
jgi:hypothetical protein